MARECSERALTCRGNELMLAAGHSTVNPSMIRINPQRWFIRILLAYHRHIASASGESMLSKHRRSAQLFEEGHTARREACR